MLKVKKLKNRLVFPDSDAGVEPEQCGIVAGTGLFRGILSGNYSG